MRSSLRRRASPPTIHSLRTQAIGEAGLDYSDGFPSREAQLPWFEAQLRLAGRLQLPLFVHERLAFADTFAALSALAKPRLPFRVMIHCFTGTQEELEACVGPQPA